MNTIIKNLKRCPTNIQDIILDYCEDIEMIKKKKRIKKELKEITMYRGGHWTWYKSKIQEGHLISYKKISIKGHSNDPAFFANLSIDEGLNYIYNNKFYTTYKVMSVRHVIEKIN